MDAAYRLVQLSGKFVSVKNIDDDEKSDNVISQLNRISKDMEELQKCLISPKIPSEIVEFELCCQSVNAVVSSWIESIPLDQEGKDSTDLPKDLASFVEARS